MHDPFQPGCVVESCRRPASLRVTEPGRYWSFVLYYCPIHFEEVGRGKYPKVVPARIQVLPREQVLSAPRPAN